jgi:hypothetical protein
MEVRTCSQSALSNTTPDEFRDHHRTIAATTGSGQAINPSD